MASIESDQLLRRPSIIDQHLASLLQTVSIEVEAGAEILNDTILSKLTELLMSDKNAVRAAEILAEMAKSEDNRIVVVQKKVIPPLIRLLDTDDPEKIRQGCRALGNMCFESQFGRQTVLQEGGIEMLSKKLLQMKPTERTSEAENSLHYVICGSLHTISMDNEEVQKEGIRLNIFPTLLQYLKYSSDSTVVRFCLNVICCYLDHGKEIVDLGISLNLVNVVSEILKSHKDDDDDVREAVLDIFNNYNMLEEPLIQMQLYQAGVVSHIVDIINTTLNEADNIQRIASEILVVILSHDGIAQLVFEDDSLGLVNEALVWMCGHQEYLKGTGALIIGNLATSDLRCEGLLNNPAILQTLFSTLNYDYSHDESMNKVKYAVLSAVKNLCISKKKNLILPYVDTIISYVFADDPMLNFKALGCLRCIMRGQDDLPTELVNRSDFIARLHTLMDKFPYHTGLQNEIPRFICNLIVVGSDSCNISLLVNSESIPTILQMAKKKHCPSLQVEGFIACQKAIPLLNKDCKQELVSAGLLQCLEDSLTDDTNPNVRILALEVLRLLSGDLAKDETVDKISEHLKRLSFDESDIPAKKLASEIKESRIFQ